MPNPSQVIGQPPDLAGSICEGLICQGFAAGGELLASANVVFVRFEGVWHRLCIDCGVIFWKMQEQTPEPWAVEEEGWTYPHIDVGASAGVIGHHLDHYEMKTTGVSGQVVFVFDDGRSIIIDNEHDRSNYRVTERPL